MSGVKWLICQARPINCQTHQTPIHVPTTSTTTITCYYTLLLHCATTTTTATNTTTQLLHYCSSPHSTCAQLVTYHLAAPLTNACMYMSLLLAPLLAPTTTVKTHDRQPSHVRLTADGSTTRARDTCLGVDHKEKRKHDDGHRRKQRSLHRYHSTPQRVSARAKRRVRSGPARESDRTGGSRVDRGDWKRGDEGLHLHSSTCRVESNTRNGQTTVVNK